MATDIRLSHAQNLELCKEHNIVGAFVNVPDVDGRTLAYCVTTEVRDFNGYMRRFFNVVTLDGRYISKGYKSAGAVTKWCRANLDEITPVVEDPSRQIEPEMVETEDDISEPNTPAGRQAWSVVKLSRDAQKYATQAEKHAKEAERLELETACYADVSEVVRTERECAEQISEAKRHTALIAPEFVEAERLARRARWAHRAAYRISSVMFFSDGPWDSVMDDWTERSSDAHASALEYRDRAEGAAQDAREHVDRAERQLDRACALCGSWYPCTRDGRRLISDLTDSRGGYNCRCGGSTPGDDISGPIEPCDGQMSFEDVPEPVAPEHETTVTELDGFYVITCSCGWTHDIDAFDREDFARGRAGNHRYQPQFDVVDEEPCEQLQKITREINGTDFTAYWERHQYVIRWNGTALQVGKTAGEAFRRLRGGLADNPEQFARLMGTETTMNQTEELTVGRASKAPRKVVAPKVGDIVFSDKSRFPCIAEVLGSRYVVRKLAGSFSAQHEHSDGARLIFEDEDPKNICRTGGDMFPNLPAVKRSILADAIQRGPVAVEHQEQPEPSGPAKRVAERGTVGGGHVSFPTKGEANQTIYVRDSSIMPLLRQEQPKPVAHADLMAVDGEELVTLLESLTEEQRLALAGQWPVRWLYPKKPGDRPRGINFCAGCGGGCKGKRLVSDTDMICVDLSGDAVATSEAAGCTVLRADVKTLTPEHPALRETEEVTFTMPCTDWTIAGKGLGRDASNLEILVEAIAQVGFAFGNYEKDGTEYCDHEENGEECTWEDGCSSSYGSRTDMTVPEMWALVDGMTSKTAGLMLAPVIWCLGLRYIGAPLTRIVVEQAAALPEEIKEEIWLELSVAGCESASWDVLDAAEFGSPSHRRRSIMAAHWYRMAALPEAPGITTLAYEAIGWEANAEINTRGVRRTSGGNVFRMDGVTRRHPDPKPINGITSKIRGWYEATTGRRFTIEEVCLLVGLPADYPVVGSRSSQCQQLGDIFSPLVSLAVWGQLLGVPWRELLRRYLGELYPAVHADTAEISDQGPAGELGQENPRADTEEIPCDHAGYAWLTIDTAAEDGRGVTVGCACGHTRLARKGKSRTSALALAECESCEVTGEWERVSDTAERVAVTWKPRPAGPTMTELLGPDWKPIEATADPEFAEEEEESQAPVQGLAPITRQQRAAAWKLAAGESTPVEKPQQPDHGRKYWEMGVRVTMDHRAGRTSSSRTGKGVQVRWDDAEDWQATWVAPEELWLEGTEPRGWFAPAVAPTLAVEDDDAPDYAAISAANRAAREQQTAAEPEPEAVEELDAPSLTWDELESSLDALWLELRAEQEETTPSRGWEELTAELSTLGGELRQADPVVVVTPVRIPRSLRRDLMTIAAAGALVTLTAASVAEVVAPRV
ncbi:hypothetical protein ACFXPT_11760 [Streptomyces goshikiensis]|uniref:hypothetical protein n=1 Tax=Streptomyces goshikiensis TaxID=1942 RepID=UPI0036BC2209